MFVMIGEDRTAMTFKAAAGVQEVLVGDDPDRFYVPPYPRHAGGMRRSATAGAPRVVIYFEWLL